MTDQVTFSGPDALLEAVGRSLGPTEWMKITQERIDAFAAATGDHQWIHVDVERARTGPFGGTIAHGFLTLSLVSQFLPWMFEVTDVSAGINYGLDRVRFPAPVRSGAHVRGRAELIEAKPIDGGVQTTIRVTVEVGGEDKPACVADAVSRWLR